MAARRIAALVAGVVILAFVGLLAFGVVRSQEAGRPVEVSQGTGKPAPDFTITTFAGEQISLSQLRGQVVVVNFWASWCVPCREEAPLLERTWRSYRDRGVTLIGVDIQDKREDALAFLREFDITYPNGPDPQGRITIDYGVFKIPTSFFISRDGTISRRWLGAIDQEHMTRFLEELLVP